MAQVYRIRDQIIISQSLLQNVKPGDTLWLVARQVILPAGVTFDVAGRNLSILAVNFKGYGGKISNSVPHLDVPPGAPPVWDVFEGTGKRGTDGKSGSSVEIPLPDGSFAPAMIRVTALVVSGLIISSRGGTGANGGRGDTGRRGQPVNVEYRPGTFGPIRVVVEPGMPGGRGGDGGSGGKGGSVEVRAVEWVDAPDVDVRGGIGGEGGQGGPPGPAGDYHLIPIGGPGLEISPVNEPPDVEIIIASEPAASEAGLRGPEGPSGEFHVDSLTLDKYDTYLTGSGVQQIAELWANYRLQAAHFYFRAYVPDSADGSAGEISNELVRGSEITRKQALRTSIDELEAAKRIYAQLKANLDPPSSPQQEAEALRIDLGMREADRILKEIRSNNNPLGLSRLLDVVPNFDSYASEYRSASSRLFETIDLASQQILSSAQMAAFDRVLQAEEGFATYEKGIADKEVVLAQQNQKDIIVAQDALDGMIADTQARIEAVKEEMKRQSVAGGSLADLAGAVMSFATAVPTGGASLMAMAPTIMQMADTVFDQENIAEIGRALFKGTQSDALDSLKGMYEEVKQNVPEVVELGKSVYDLVKVIDSLGTMKTPQNSSMMLLLQNLAELSYERLLKEQEYNREARVQAAGEARSLQADQLRERIVRLQNETGNDTNRLRETGLVLIARVTKSVDRVLEIAFLAQRSAEIYTLIPHTQHVLYDAGYIPPDTMADYREGLADDIGILNQYMRAWQLLHEPDDMWTSYNGHFRDHDFDPATFRRTFSDPADLQEFITTGKFAFVLDVSDVSGPQNTRYETKALSIRFALIGGQPENGIVTVTVTHGSRYTQPTLVGGIRKVRDDVLSPQDVSLDCGFKDLGEDAGPPVQDAPSQGPMALDFWGRGVCGRYEIQITDTQPVDLSRLIGIQVWITYQFFK